MTFMGVANTGVASGDSSSAQLTVGVTVVRSCAIDVRAVDDSSPALRLTCAAGANSNLIVSKTVQQPAATVVSDGATVITLNF